MLKFNRSWSKLKRSKKLDRESCQLLKSFWSQFLIITKIYVSITWKQSIIVFRATNNTSPNWSHILKPKTAPKPKFELQDDQSQSRHLDGKFKEEKQQQRMASLPIRPATWHFKKLKMAPFWGKHYFFTFHLIFASTRQFACWDVNCDRSSCSTDKRPSLSHSSVILTQYSRHFKPNPPTRYFINSVRRGGHKDVTFRNNLIQRRHVVTFLCQKQRSATWTNLNVTF